jgi:hypothetical protein
MITPFTIRDVEEATDDEIVAAYVAEGKSEDEARGFLSILRGDVPPGSSFD